MTEQQRENETIGLSVQAAWDLLKSDPRAVLIDIRSGMEFLFVGHPVGALHIPWIDEPDWEQNPNFVTEVRKALLGGCDGDAAVPIVLICRSGKRSLLAGQELIKHRVGRVYHIEEGFEGDRDEAYQRSTLGGWRFHGLPWEQC